jgi:hypothetical protein
MQRFRGKPGGRQGTFVRQGSEIVESGKIKAEWFVVPGSGQVHFPGCAVRAALKANLEKGPTQRLIIGSNEVATKTAGHTDVDQRTQARNVMPTNGPKTLCRMVLHQSQDRVAQLNDAKTS